MLYQVELAPAWFDGVLGYDDASMALAVAVCLTLLSICVLAAPGFRTRRHDVFEASHRFGTWMVPALSWANTLIPAYLQMPARSFGHAYCTHRFSGC